MIHAVSASPKSKLPVPFLPKETERKTSLLNERFVTLVGRGRDFLLRIRPESAKRAVNGIQ